MRRAAPIKQARRSSWTRSRLLPSRRYLPTPSPHVAWRARVHRARRARLGLDLVERPWPPRVSTALRLRVARQRPPLTPRAQRKTAIVESRTKRRLLKIEPRQPIGQPKQIRLVVRGHVMGDEPCRPGLAKFSNEPPSTYAARCGRPQRRLRPAQECPSASLWKRCRHRWRVADTPNFSAMNRQKSGTAVGAS